MKAIFASLLIISTTTSCTYNVYVTPEQMEQLSKAKVYQISKPEPVIPSTTGA